MNDLGGADERTNERLASLLKGLLDATPDLVFAKGLDYRYISHNEAFAQLVGRPGECLVGRSDQDVFSDTEAIQRLRHNDETIIQSKETIRSLESATYPDGRQVLLDTLKAPFFDEEGKLVGLLGVSRDVTLRVAAEKAANVEKEKAQQASQAKSEFLAKMSHEIRTPMNAVIGLSKLLRKTRLEAEQGDYVDKIIASADTLLNIINDILDYSKMEAKRLSIERVPFNLQSVIDRAITICELKAQEKNIELVLDLPSRVPHDLQGDPHRLQQILINLISNAIKFTERGHVLVSASVLAQDDDQATLSFAVSDSGIGISAEQQERLFLSFSQVDNSFARQFEGTGLGLAISKQLVELMGGEISVESQPGQGSTFSFSIDFLTHQNNSASCPQFDYRNLRALVVDDNSIARRIVREMLLELGVTVDCAANGKEAVDRVLQVCASESAYDFILMDWRMPELDGISAATRIKRDHGQAHLPAVLLLSAYDLDEAKKAATDQQIDWFLEKPVSARTLKEAVYRILAASCSDPVCRRVIGEQDAAPVMYRDSRILLVDDNAINRTVVLGFLEETGVAIDIAVNGLEALEKVSQCQYDLVLMDIQMPKMDGLTATGIIRNQQQYASLPIVAMTANAMAGDEEKCLAAGMSDYLAKPIDPGELCLLLDRWLTKDCGANPDRLNGVKAEAPIGSFIDRLADDGVLAIEQALARCQGRVGFLENLIVDFCREYRHAGADLMSLYGSGDHQAIFIRAHSLKASASYVGALELADASARLEKAAQQHEVREAELVGVCQLLYSLIEKLDAAIQIRPSAAILNEQPIEDALPGLLSRLHPLLAASDFSVERDLVDLVALCQATPYEEAAVTIERLVADIQFERAAEQCASLLQNIQHQRND